MSYEYKSTRSLQLTSKMAPHAADITLPRPSTIVPLSREQLALFDPIYEPKNVATSSSSTKLLSREHLNLYSILHKVLSYFPQRTLYNCCLVNFSFYSICNPFLWNQPQFGGSCVTALSSFRKFLACIQLSREITRTYIRVLDISNVHETMYTTIDESWLHTVVTQCPRLLELRCKNTEFFSSASIRLCTRGQLHNDSVKLLDITECTQLTEHALKALSTIFPSLEHLVLDNTSGTTDASISKFADEYPRLHTLVIRSSRNLTDLGLTAIAKFCKINLRHLDLSHNLRITNDGLLTIAKYCIHLESINLAYCSLLTDTGIIGIAKATSRTLRSLDIFRCKGLRFNLETLAQIATYATQLESLSFSFVLLDQHKNTSQEILAVLASFRNITCLTLHEIPEHTSMNFIRQIIASTPTLRYLILLREFYSSDFILGGYTDIKAPSKANGQNSDENLLCEIEAFNREVDQKVKIDIRFGEGVVSQ